MIQFRPGENRGQGRGHWKRHPGERTLRKLWQLAIFCFPYLYRLVTYFHVSVAAQRSAPTHPGTLEFDLRATRRSYVFARRRCVRFRRPGNNVDTLKCLFCFRVTSFFTRAKRERRTRYFVRTQRQRSSVPRWPRNGTGCLIDPSLSRQGEGSGLYT